jgi:hypothetical protein
MNSLPLLNINRPVPQCIRSRDREHGARIIAQNGKKLLQDAEKKKVT